jgi:hypothetical protein
MIPADAANPRLSPSADEHVAGWKLPRFFRSKRTALAVVVVLLAVLELALTAALTHLSAAYDKLTGRPHEARRTSPWLRSLRGEREESARKKYGISAIERIAVISVVDFCA